MLRTLATVVIVTLVVSGAATPASEAKKAKREGPLKDLPSPPGAQLAKVMDLGEDQWVQLGPPKGDPKFGVARGRSWGGRALIYAPDIEGAYFYGEGPHAGVKPDGYGMDDLWVYDINAHQWIAVYPGMQIATFNDRVKKKELLINKLGVIADKDDQPIPYHALIHAWDLLAYDTDLHQFAFLGSPIAGRYYLPGGEQVEEGMKLLDAQKAGKGGVGLSPWLLNTNTGKFQLDVVSAGAVDCGGYPNFQYVPSRKQYFLGGAQAVCWYDPAKKAWSVESDKGPRPPSYDHGGCYDSKRDRIYMGPGDASASGVFVYDIAAKTWVKPPSKGNGPQSFRTNDASIFYDVANDVVTVFHYAGAKLYTYFPDKDAWEDRKLPESVLKCISYPSFNAFYDAKLNAYFVYAASDGGDNGIMWGYRYKNAKPAKKK